MAKLKSSHRTQKQFLYGKEKLFQAIRQRFETEYLSCVEEEYRHLLPIFERLYLECREYETYSVIEAAQKLSLDYQKIQEWAQDDEVLAHVLLLCRDSCLNNAEKALVCNYIDRKKGIRYFIENSDEDTPDRENYLQELKRIEQETIDKSPKGIVMAQEVEPKEEAPKAQVQLTDIDQARLNEWRNKKGDTDTRFKFAPDSKYDPETKNTICTLKVEFDKEIDESQQSSIAASTFCAATGASSKDYAGVLFCQMTGALTKLDADSVNAAFKALLSMKPADEYEGMLISRLIVLHQQYMNYMARVNNATNKELRESLINSATKLMRVYNETLDALNKHRRKGEQKVTVTHNHVNVNDGGKAIVGSEINQQTGGGDNDKK